MIFLLLIILLLTNNNSMDNNNNNMYNNNYYNDYYNVFGDSYEDIINKRKKEQENMEKELYIKKEFEDDLIEEEYEIARIDKEIVIENQEIFYPQLPDYDCWQSFLNRKLTDKEQNILNNYIIENNTNFQIKSLKYNLILNGFFTIPKLTKNNGNCLFESLSYLGFGKASEIRKNISALLLLVKNNCDFFPNRNICPEELFNNCNDVQVVKDAKTNTIYEYDYDMMITDLYTNHSWTRLPMELILLTISRIYEINIHIFSNKSDYVNKVSAWQNDDYDMETIYLGHLNEEHYLPVFKIDYEITKEPLLMDEVINSYPIYINAKKKYNKWGKKMAKMKTLINHNSFYNFDDFNNFDNFDMHT